MPGPLGRSEALVMRHLDYGEADRIVTLLTPELGMFKGFARAARNSRKRFGSSFEPFSRIDVQWCSGRGDLCTLLEADLLDARTPLRQDLQRIALASYGVELVELLLHEGEPYPDIYRLLQGFLDFLAAGGTAEVARLLFELRLVQLLGYVPHLLHCSSCFVVFGEADQIVFDAGRGGSLCPACTGQNVPLRLCLGTLGSLARSLQTPVDRFAGFRFGARTLDEGTQLLDAVLRQVLPRPPKSLCFLQDVSGSTEP